MRDMSISQNNIATPLESVLIQPIRKFGEDYFGRRFRINEMDSETEISAGFGIADVVFFQLNDEVVAARKTLPLEPIQSEGIIKTLLLIKNKKKVSLTYLADNLPFSEKELRYRILRFLEDHSLIYKADGDDYRINYNYNIGLNHSVAVEAKIKDWQRGLYQAYRYKWFANLSYLALYKDFIEQPRKNLHLFKKLNVGLLSVGDNDVEEVLYDPQKEKPQSRYMTAVAFEKLLARIY